MNKLSGLPAEIFRDKDYNPTINKFWDKHGVTIILPEGGPFEPNDDHPAVRIVSKDLGGREPYLHAEPYHKEPGEYFAFGGSLIYTPDSRFPNRYPIKLHDRRMNLENKPHLLPDAKMNEPIFKPEPFETKMNFIPEWTKEQFTIMEKAIANHFADKPLHTSEGIIRPRNNSYRELDKVIGLSYTSSGMFASYSLTNPEVYLDKDCRYRYVEFTIGTDGRPYAWLLDKDRNELVLPL